ncbi:MAG: hypothetical protein R3E95_16770 [Thiolinea sp.]
MNGIFNYQTPGQALQSNHEQWLKREASIRKRRDPVQKPVAAGLTQALQWVEILVQSAMSGQPVAGGEARPGTSPDQVLTTLMFGEEDERSLQPLDDRDDQPWPDVTTSSLGEETGEPVAAPTYTYSAVPTTDEQDTPLLTAEPPPEQQAVSAEPVSTLALGEEDGGLFGWTAVGEAEGGAVSNALNVADASATEQGGREPESARVSSPETAVQAVPK